MKINIDRAKGILHNIQGKRVLVIGDFMLDRYVWGECERISPKAPVPVIQVSGETTRLGGAANVAMNIRKRGGKPMLLGIIGADSTAEDFRAILRDDGITDDYLLELPQRPTTIKTRVIAQNQQVVRVDREDSRDIDEQELLKAQQIITDATNECDGILISDYGKGLITSELLEFVLTIARERGLFISVDPKERHFELYHGISLMTPNTREAGYAAGFRLDTEQRVIEAGMLLRRRMDAESLLITRGPEGMSIFSKDKDPVHLPTKAQKVFDVTGAGDTVIAVATLARIAGADMVESAILANHAAGISVGELGTRSVTPDELLEAIKQDGT